MLRILYPSGGPPWAQTLSKAQRAYDEIRETRSGSLPETALWLLTEQVYHDLRLDGIRLEWRRIAELIREHGAPSTDEEAMALHYSRAVRQLCETIAALKQGERSGPGMTPDWLRSLHRCVVGERDEAAGQYRIVEINPLYPGHKPAVPVEVPRLVEVALEWFAADSLGELHPVEQAALVHLRLTELQPFGKANGRITRLVASFVTMRSGLPPIIVTESDSDAYYQALLTGFQFATQPLVELFARSLTSALKCMTELGTAETPDGEDQPAG